MTAVATHNLLDLRRARTPLPGLQRCARAEALGLRRRIEDELDAAEARWLEVHHGRCARCREHEALIDALLAELVKATSTPAAAPTPSTVLVLRDDSGRIHPSHVLWALLIVLAGVAGWEAFLS